MLFGDILTVAAAGGGGVALTPGQTAANAWAAAVVVNGGTVSAGRKTLIATLIDAHVTSGAWATIDDELPLCAENAPQALTSLKQLRLATVTAAPTFTIDRGYAFNGTTQFINTNFVPSTMALVMTASGARLASYERTNVGANLTCSLGATNSNMSMNPRNGTSVFQASLLSGAGNIAASIADSRGLSVVSFTGGSNTRDGWKNGVALAGAAVTTAGVLAVNAFYVAARNSGGTADQFRAATQGWSSWGGPMSGAQEASYYTALQTFLTAIGANV